jgi:hypothetical protein
MRSASSVGSPDGSVPEIPAAAWRQHAKCPSCGTEVVRNPDAETPKLAEWRYDGRQPLAQFGGTAIMRSTDVPSGTPRVVHGSAHLSASGTLSAGGEVVPATVSAQQVWIRRTEWEAALTGVGLGIGSLGGKLGAVVGGGAAFIWSRYRWSDE